MNKKIPHGIITPIHERLFLCKCCGAKLTFKERCQKRRYGKVACSKCNVLNYSHKFIV